MSIFLAKQGTTDPVDDPTPVEGQAGQGLTLDVRLRNESGSSINTFSFVNGDKVSAAWVADTPPLSIPNNQQQSIRLTFDDSEALEDFDTTFQVNTSGGNAAMNIRLNISLPPAAGRALGESVTVISQPFPATRPL